MIVYRFLVISISIKVSIFYQIYAKFYYLLKKHFEIFLFMLLENYYFYKKMIYKIIFSNNYKQINEKKYFKMIINFLYKFN